MRLLVGLCLVVAFTATDAASYFPRAPVKRSESTVVEAAGPLEEVPVLKERTEPPQVVTESPQEFDLTTTIMEGTNALVNGTLTMFLDMNKRIQEDIKKFNDDLKTMRELLGQPVYPARPPVINSFWDIWNFDRPNTTDRSGGWPLGSDSDLDLWLGSDSDLDLWPGSSFGDGEDGGLFDSKSVLDVFPEIPGVPNPADLPDHYNNSTHEVHIVNGHRVSVNTTTINDGLNSFFHSQVIHIKPDHGEEEEQDGEESTPQPEVEGDGTANPKPEVSLPEVNAELNALESASESNDIDDSFVEVGLLKNIRELDTRPIRFPSHDTNVRYDLPIRPHNNILPPGPLSASYSYHHYNNDAEDFENRLDNIPPPDLSGDTAVNRWPASSQGMVMIEPDAEIFDFDKVVEDSNDLEFA